MSAPHYSFRPGRWTPELAFWIGRDELRWRSGDAEDVLPYSDVSEVCTFRQLARGEAIVRTRYVDGLTIKTRAGQRLTISPLHYAGFRNWVDRSASYRPFVDALVPRLKRYSQVTFVSSERWQLRLRNRITRSLPPLLGLLGKSLLRAVRCLGLDRASDFGGWIARTIGPHLPATQVARTNLKAAFPQQSAAVTEQTIRAVWDNFGRSMAEYAFMDDLYDYDPANENRIVLDPQTKERATKIGRNGAPVFFFSGHLGSWELGPLADAFDIRLAGVFRPFKSAALNDLIVRTRSRMKLIPARLGAAAEIEACLREGWSLGMLVDQHFGTGVDVTFFGRRCKANPMLARLARKYEYPIYGGRVVRTGRSEFKAELTAPLEPPRDSEGKIEVIATMQMITDVLEGWIRENPEQWLWLHRRWR